jgi:hypothetical protein
VPNWRLRLIRSLPIGVLTVAMLTAASTASAALCTSGFAHNYGKPLQGMPATRKAPLEHLPFAPTRVFFARVGPGPLLVGESKVGINLSYTPYHPGHHLSPPLNWLVEVRLSRVDRRGRQTELVKLLKRRVKRVRSAEDKPSGDVTLASSISEPGLYRVTIAFSDLSGAHLARYSEYVRLLPVIQSVQLSLNGSSFRPGESIDATLENRGTEMLRYGLGYTIESFDGATWSRSSIDPPQPVLAIGLSSGPGEKASCWTFQIPPDAPSGLYRFAWSGEALIPGASPARARKLEFQPEFTIGPPE